MKGIYERLVRIETNCIEADKAQSADLDQELTKDRWQTLIALYRDLLYEHHDFLMTSQHPQANTALRRLASKCVLPAPYTTI
ncbi:unnamed protein product [Clonostachys chloroleuca]|uniref:Uncharacterized protein n=1 Tax=Clonostachys chloroleuca TaxID=1926264 RepID=A0AA35M6D2_9HYPO|nr:unnamed protein product [Clonostachys chloroleuca]